MFFGETKRFFYGITATPFFKSAMPCGLEYIKQFSSVSYQDITVTKMDKAYQNTL